MSLSGWSSIWQIITVVSLAVAFAGGLGTYLTGKWLSERQEADNREQARVILELSKSVNDSKTDLSKALTKQAETEIALEKVRSGLGQRIILGEKAEAFKKALSGKPRATVEIWFEPQDGEAYIFAQWIAGLISGAGWELTSSPRPIPEIGTSNRADAGLPLAMRATGGMKAGLCIAANKLPQVAKEQFDAFPVWVLFNAFEAAGKPSGAVEDRELPEGTLRVIVGARP
jgi:hypothetical protein